jgi:threonine synthase
LQYISTRGETPASNFDDVLLSGLAPDGGLFVPENWPQLSAEEVAALQGLPYPELALRVLKPFVGGTVPDAALAGIIDGAYEHFDTPEIAPLKQIGDNEWLLELFHGPTLAFKDMALQVLGPLFDHVLKTRGEKVTIIGATSGDTGSAAIEACRDRDNIDIFMLHPKGRVSEVQRRQMTTVMADNVHNIAIEGTFDDCQALLKAAFGDVAFRDEMALSAVNSINWARVMAQTVYYFVAAVALGAPRQSVAFAVPSGNFGNVFAGFVAHRMGLDIKRLVVATNSNDILARFFDSGRYETATVTPTVSPSMDIQVSSNFERLLYDLYDHDGNAVSRLLGELADQGGFAVDDARLARARALFTGYRLDDAATEETIALLHRDNGMTIDPHTAIGVAAGRACRPDQAVPMIALGCAHPAKFPDVVARATGTRPPLPPQLADLYDRPETCEVLPNDLSAVQDFIRGKGTAKTTGS